MTTTDDILSGKPNTHSIATNDLLALYYQMHPTPDIRPEVAEAILDLRMHKRPIHPVSGFYSGKTVFRDVDILLNSPNRSAAESMDHFTLFYHDGGDELKAVVGKRNPKSANGFDLYVFSADIKNQRGINLALDGQDISAPTDKTAQPEEANLLLALMCKRFQKEVEQFALEPDADPKTTCKRIKENVSQLVKDVGLTNIMHGNPTHHKNFDKRGSGITVVGKMVEPGTSVLELESQLEAALEDTSKEANEHSLTDRKERRSDERDQAARDRRQPKQPKLKEAEISKNGMAAKLKPEAFRESRRKIILAYGLEVGMQRKVVANEPRLFSAISPSREQLEAYGARAIDPQVVRLVKANELVRLLEMTPTEQTLFLKEYSDYESYRAHEKQSVEPIQQFISRYSELGNAGKKPKLHLVAFRVENMKGLNDALKHDGCDAVMEKAMLPVIAFGMEKNIAPAVAKKTPFVCRPGKGGNTIYLFVPEQEGVPLSAEDVKKIANTMSNELVKAGFQKSCNLAGLPNPRHPDKPGVSISTAVIPLHEVPPEKLADVGSFMQELENNLDEEFAQGHSFAVSDPTGFVEQVTKGIKPADLHATPRRTRLAKIRSSVTTQR